MANHKIHDATTANVLAWSAHAANSQLSLEEEVPTEVDEPPDTRTSSQSPHPFRRTMVRKHSEQQHESLLTKALHPSEEEIASQQQISRPARRRSMNSNISLPSTADLTSDTGFTSPARTNTPSPPPPELPLHRLNHDMFDLNKLHNGPPVEELSDITPTKRAAVVPTGRASPTAKDSAVEALARKRCIQFACAAKPVPAAASTAATSTESARPAGPAQDAPKRPTCIKFACPAKPSTDSTTRADKEKPVQVPAIREPAIAKRTESPSMPRKVRSHSSHRSNRSLTPRPAPQIQVSPRNAKYLVANRNDLEQESCRFNEFAAGEAQEEDWIRLNRVSSGHKLTINDTLKKENEIRRLGKEAEEEALEEELEDEELENADDDDDEEDDGDNLDHDDENAEDEGDYDDEFEDDEDDQEFSDGYNTDNEVGFADSDDGEEEDEELQLWTTGSGYVSRLSGETPTRRRPSLSGNRSDSSSSGNSKSRSRRQRARRIKIRPGTPELPDSTDFVCGTLDEDRPAEKAYMNCIAARRAEKLHPVPQDIDPSFPTSEPDDDEDEHSQKGDESDEDVWVHGELEDLDGDSDRAARQRRKSKTVSPKRYRSPPPKRHHSPPPKPRGRSPRRLFDGSPKRLRSPRPHGHVVIKSPPASPQQRGAIAFHKTLASRPGLTQTKSLPRTSMLHQHLKNRRPRPAANRSGVHVRGAIDIVKGLEQKRQRRKEKFAQKHCNRARKGQVYEKRPLPGKGAERMRELGLHMAGKLGHDLHILSV